MSRSSFIASIVLLVVAAALSAHDSHTALAAVPGALLATGPTGTNAADLAIYLREGMSIAAM